MEHYLRALTMAVGLENRCAAALLKEMTMKVLLSPLMGRLLILLRDLGPYAGIELLLPGGSVVVLLYWWYRHRARRMRDNPHSSAQTDSFSVCRPQLEHRRA
jgi:hypothetical protein